jgi:hypothetical protein
MSRRRSKTSKRPPKGATVKPGDAVLLGGTSASYPGDWFFARVLWSDGIDALVERGDLTGTQRWREVVSVAEVRAVGTVPELLAVKEAARKAVHALRGRVDIAERRLGNARDDLWAKLDRLAKEGLKIVPLDRRAIRAHTVVVRTARNLLDIQLAASREEIERLTEAV